MEHRFYAGTIKNGWLYFSDIQFNGLYKTELVSGHTFFIDLFYGAHIQDKKLHRIAIATEDYIFFIPQYSKYFHVLDLKTEKLSILHSKFELEGRFSDAVCLGNRIYLIPMYGTGRLAYIDINQMIIEYDTRFDYFYKKMINDQIVTKRVVRKNDDLLFGLFGTDKIIKFNMENGGFEKFESGVPDINGIYTSNNGFWITSNSERDLFLWNGMKTERYQCNDSYDTNHPVGRYAQVIEFNSNVYAIKNSKHFLYILKDKEFTFVPLSQNYPQKEGYSVDFYGYAVSGNYMYLFPVSGETLLVVRDEYVEHLKFKDDYKKRREEKMKKQIGVTQEILYEDTYTGINQLINMLHN